MRYIHQPRLEAAAPAITSGTPVQLSAATVRPSIGSLRAGGFSLIAMHQQE